MELYELTIYNDTDTIRWFLVEPAEDSHYKSGMSHISVTIKKFFVNIQNGRVVDVDKEPKLGERHATTYIENLSPKKKFFDKGSDKALMKAIFRLNYK